GGRLVVAVAGNEARGAAMNALQRILHMAREDVFGGPLAVERDLRRHRTFGARAAQAGHDRLQRMMHGIDDGGRLVAAMHHAVGALLVIAGAVAVPIGLLHQLAEALGIAFAEQVAGALPAEHVARRVAPGRAAIGLVAGEEVEEERRLGEAPLLALAALEDLA